MTSTGTALRIGIAGSLAISAAIHAYLYIHGYQHVPTIGTAFLIQASVSFAVALLVLTGGPAWLYWTAAIVAGGALLAFVSSRTVGLLSAKTSPGRRDDGRDQRGVREVLLQVSQDQHDHRRPRRYGGAADVW